MKKVSLAIAPLVMIGVLLFGTSPAFALSNEVPSSCQEGGAPMRITEDALPTGGVTNSIYNARVTYGDAEGSTPINMLGLYSWYGGTLSFATEATGATRYYDGNSVGIEMTTVSQTVGATDTHFSVELHRGDGTYVGSAALARNGRTRAVWTNVNSGYYYFKFVKASDGIWVTSSDVAMFSW